jgi:hypothetical protein
MCSFKICLTNISLYNKFIFLMAYYIILCNIMNSLKSQDTKCNWSSFRVQSSKLLYDWRFTANQFILATSPLRTMTRIFIFQLNPCGYSPSVTSSLTKGWVCCLQLLLGLASAVLLGPSPTGLNHILLSDLRLPPTWRARSPYLHPPGTGWPDYTPRHWVPFLSPPTTRRATVEIFDPASTWDFSPNTLFFPHWSSCSVCSIFEQ